MAYELIPGIRQDHRGRSYQVGRYPNGKCINVPVEEAKLSARLEAEMEHILVESRSTLTLEDPLLNERTKQRLAKGDLYKRNETYETIRCIHESSI